MWECPECKRKFTRKNQRHTCGTGDKAGVLRNRSKAIRNLYEAIEGFVKKLDDVEVVARDRYVLFRSKRVFTDLSIMTDAIRVAIHIGRRVEKPIFIKVVSDAKSVTHVAKIKSLEELTAIKPYLKEAYEFSMSSAEDS